MGERAAPAAPAAELSVNEEMLWFIERLGAPPSLHAVPVALRLDGRLDADLLQAALSALVGRHAALRTRYPERDGTPQRVVDPPQPMPLAVLDLSAAPDAPAALGRALRADAARPFDLAAGPLFRPVLYRLGPREHVLGLTAHHLVTDGWSFALVLRELDAAYAALDAGRPLLPEPAAQYADFVRCQRAELESPRFQADLAWWKSRLTDAPPLELPGDRPRPAAQSFRGARHRFAFEPELMEELRAFSRRHNTTLFTTLLCGFEILLARSTGQRDIVLGVPFSGRTQARFEQVVGMFVNTLPLRFSLVDGDGFAQTLRRLRAELLTVFDHQTVPFGEIVRELRPARDLSRQPVFQVVVNSHEPAPGELFGTCVRELLFNAPETAKFDLTLAFGPAGDAWIEYATDLFDEPTAAAMARRYVTLLRSALADPELPIARLSLLDPAERRMLLVDFNQNGSVVRGDRCLHELVAEQAARTPGALAVVCENQQLTYAELERCADPLARRLRELGVGPGVAVAVNLERSAELIVALLAVLQAGGAYVPLENTFPAERLTFMVEDSGAPVLLTQPHLAADFAPPGVRVVHVDRADAGELDRSALGPPPDDPPPRRAAPRDLAYVTYTSGSTGRPKGVAVEHRQIARFLESFPEVGAHDVVLHVGPLTFDPSTFEIWGALTAGACLALYPPQPPEVEPLRRTVRRHEATIVWLPAAIFHVVAASDPSALAGVRLLLTGGDVVDPRHAERVLRALPGTDLIHVYGPTETTVFSTRLFVRDVGSSGIPLGRPLRDVRAYVLDEHLELVPAGSIGELCLGGGCVARGYWNRPGLTAERFLPDPFSPGRMYRTGDRARWRPGGDLEFLGRTDHQVKVRGFRMELGEIGAALREDCGAREAVVLVHQDASGEKRLIAYLAFPPGCAPADDQLRAQLRRRLPEPMIPAVFVRLAGLPTTSNGKLDRRALPPPPDVPAASGAYVVPRDETESRVAAAFAEVLNGGPIGADDDFFDRGGHSLLAVRAIALLNQAGFLLRLADLFEARTPAALAILARAAAQPVASDSGSSEVSGPSEDGLWFLQP